MKLGSSPSDLTDFFHIKEQINYLSRADKATDWKKVKVLSEKLLAENGTDLQTLVYLAVANDKLKSDFHQLNHDVEMLAIALVSHWDEIWPQDISARITILNWLNRQISDGVRMHHLTQKNIQDYFGLVNSLSLMTSMLESKGHSSNLSYLLEFMSQEIKTFKANIDLSHASSDTGEKNNITTLSPISLAKAKILPIKTSQENSISTSVSSQKANLSDSQIEIKTEPKLKNSDNKKVKSTALSHLFVAFVLGGMLCGAISYTVFKVNDDKLNMQPETLIGSPTELVNTINLTISRQNEDVRVKLQNRIEEHLQNGSRLIKPNEVGQKLTKLQNDLLQAEKTKQGLTISYLKTALYEIEKEFHLMNCLECDIFHYKNNGRDIELEQKINNRFFDLLFYYNNLILSQYELEIQGKYNGRLSERN